MKGKGKKNVILTIQLIYAKIKTMEKDVKGWNIANLREADQREVARLLDRIYKLKCELDGISTLELAKMTTKDVKDIEGRLNALMGDWIELKNLIGFLCKSTTDKYFKILKMKPTSDFEAIKRAYKKRAHDVHPDRGGNDKEFLKVKDAYDRLREEYEK